MTDEIYLRSIDKKLIASVPALRCPCDGATSLDLKNRINTRSPATSACACTAAQCSATRTRPVAQNHAHGAPRDGTSSELGKISRDRACGSQRMRRQWQ
jgi:hypothetical protein